MPETAASPTLATMMVSAIPIAAASICSMKSGTIHRRTCLENNILFSSFLKAAAIILLTFLKINVFYEFIIGKETSAYILRKNCLFAQFYPIFQVMTMKIFLVTKKNLLYFSLVFALALSLFISGTNISVSVLGNAEITRLLPIYCVDRGQEKLCSITFDAAWDDSDTDRLISILNKHNAKATFFMVGSWVEKYSESVKKFAAEGHEIMNHSDTHPHISQLSEEKIKEEITRCADKIEAVTGKRSDLFRGPYGEYNDAVIRAAESLGHKTIQWDVDSLDWKELGVDDMVNRVTKRVKPGSIVLFHNGVKNTPDALDKILEALTKEGYRFVPVGELIYKENYSIDHQGKQLPEQPNSDNPGSVENSPT